MAIAEDERFHEVIDGRLVRKASPSSKHGNAQAGLIAFLRNPFHRRIGGPLPGGWWILSEVEVELAPQQVFRPDVVGWRRDRLTALPDDAPVRCRPDWVCEILSASNRSHDLVKKLRVYHTCQVPHYWIVDPVSETLMVHRWTRDGYLLVLAADRGERVRAEPFDAVELSLGMLFGDEDVESQP